MFSKYAKIIFTIAVGIATIIAGIGSGRDLYNCIFDAKVDDQTPSYDNSFSSIKLKCFAGEDYRIFDKRVIITVTKIYEYQRKTKIVVRVKVPNRQLYTMNLRKGKRNKFKYYDKAYYVVAENAVLQDRYAILSIIAL